MSAQGDLRRLGIETSDLADVDFFKGAIQTLTRGPVVFYTNKATLADDASFDLTPQGPGFLLVAAENDEAALFAYELSGAIIKIAGTTNTAATDSDTDLCAFLNSAKVRVRNRLGSSKVVTAISFEHKA